MNDNENVSIRDAEASVNGGVTDEIATAEAVVSLLDLVSLGKATTAKKVVLELVENIAEGLGASAAISLLEFDSPPEYTQAEDSDALLVDFRNEHSDYYDEYNRFDTYTLEFTADVNQEVDKSNLSVVFDLRGEGIYLPEGPTGDLPLSTTYKRQVNVPLQAENSRPSARFRVEDDQPRTKQTTIFNATAAQDIDGTIAEYRWDFDGDGNVETVTSDPVVTYTFTESGSIPVELTVVDDDGSETTTTVDLTVEQSDISISSDPETWDIGQTLQSGTKSRTITITNTGSADTSITASGGPGLSISGVPDELGQGESADISVTLDAQEYEGDPIVIQHDSGIQSIPVSVTVVSSDDLTRTDSTGLEDEDIDCVFIADVWGDDRSYCDENGRTWSDTFDIDDDEYPGLDSAELTISYRPDGPGAEDNPLEVFVNGEQVTTLESTDPESTQDNDFVTETVSIEESILESGENTVTLETSGFSGYDIGDSDTEIEYTYFEEPDLEVTTGEFENELEVGDTVRVPVKLSNDGGRPAEDVVLGTSGPFDGDAVEVVEWPDNYGINSERTIAPGSSDVRYFVLKLTEDTQATATFGALSDSDDDEVSITISPPNDPPRVSDVEVSHSEVTAQKEITYSATVRDPDGDSVAVELEVYVPSSDEWQSLGEKSTSGSGSLSWSATPFSSNDEGNPTKYRLIYDDGQGHSGTWGQFSGPEVIDDDTSAPQFSEWRYPATVMAGDDITVRTSVSDKSGVSSVVLEYTFSDGQTDTISLERNGETWEGTIPAPDKSTDMVSFVVTATDGDDSPLSATATEREVVVQTNQDNDGWVDSVDPTPNEANTDGQWAADGRQGETKVDTDGDGTPNYADPDNDGDGFTDSEEVQAGSLPLDAESTPDDKLVSVETNAVQSGSDQTIEFTLSNSGNASGVLLNVTAPDSTSIVGQSSQTGDWDSSETEWTWESVESNSSVDSTVTLSVPADVGESYTLTVVAKSADGEVVTRTVNVSKSVSIPEAVDENNDGRIGDLEILQAIEMWRTDDAVPNTGGKVIEDLKILELIEMWRNDTPV